MRLPNYLWPRERNSADGILIRLGRFVHWISAALGAVLIAIALVMATVALLSGQAWAQQHQTSNQSASHQVKPYVRGQTGTLSDVIETGPDLQQYPAATADSFQPPKKTVDWALLQLSVGVFFGGLALLLLGRGVRYIFANE